VAGVFFGSSNFTLGAAASVLSAAEETGLEAACTGETSDSAEETGETG